jgi:hypothetical protein
LPQVVDRRRRPGREQRQRARVTAGEARLARGAVHGEVAVLAVLEPHRHEERGPRGHARARSRGVDAGGGEIRERPRLARAQDAALERARAVGLAQRVGLALPAPPHAALERARAAQDEHAAVPFGEEQRQ